MAVVPLDAVSRRFRLEDFLDYPVPRGLRGSLRLDRHSIPDFHAHCSSLQTSTTSDSLSVS